MEVFEWLHLDTDAASDVQLRLCIIAHIDAARHRGRETTERVLNSVLRRSTLAADVHTFVRACIHGLWTIGGAKISLPLGSAVHGTSPNDLL